MLLLGLCDRITYIGSESYKQIVNVLRIRDKTEQQNRIIPSVTLDQDKCSCHNLVFITTNSTHVMYENCG